MYGSHFTIHLKTRFFEGTAGADLDIVAGNRMVREMCFERYKVLKENPCILKSCHAGHAFFFRVNGLIFPKSDLPI